MGNNTSINNEENEHDPDHIKDDNENITDRDEMEFLPPRKRRGPLTIVVAIILIVILVGQLAIERQ